MWHPSSLDGLMREGPGGDDPDHGLTVLDGDLEALPLLHAIPLIFVVDQRARFCVPRRCKIDRFYNVVRQESYGPVCLYC